MFKIVFLMVGDSVMMLIECFMVVCVLLLVLVELLLDVDVMV